MWLYDATTRVSYELLREIHAGGEGHTWQARQLGCSRRKLAVAVKILSRQNYFDQGLDDDAVFELWKRQAEIIRYFNDRAFVPIQAVFRTAVAPGKPPARAHLLGLPAVVTAWVDGEGLGEWSRRVEDPLSRLAVLSGCGAALDRFHSEMGHVHRDLNPNNILVAADGTGVIIDYGLLRDVSVPRSGTAAFGTSSYLAPEILDGKPYSEATDRYSFAAIIYHQLLREDPPKIGISQRQHVAAARLAAGGYRPVAGLIAGWLSDEPTSRPDSGGAAQMLERVMHSVRVTVAARQDCRPELLTDQRTRPVAEPPPGGRTAPLPDAGLGQHGTAAAEVPIRLRRTLLPASVVFLTILAAFALTHLLSR